jgi:predicted small secreted protein
MRRVLLIAAIPLGLATLSGCKTASAAGDAVQSVGSAAAEVPSLVNVNLSNVLNNLALDLHVDKANIPINAQIPITVAANICGVSINVLSVSTGGSPSCSATTTSPQLDQVVQQQLAANGSVGGGGQTTQGSTTATQAPTNTTTTTTTTQPQQPQ